MIPLHRVAAPLVALLAVGALAGCSQEAADAPIAGPTPGDAGPATSAPTAAKSVAPSPATPAATRNLPVPELPEWGTTFTQDGASTFAGYYVQVLTYARNSGDVDLLQSISDPGCSGCAQDLDEIQQMLDHSYSHVDLDTRFRGTWYRSWDPTIGEAQMDVTVDRPAHTIVDRNGNQIADVPELREASFFLWLKWIGDRWIVWESE